MVSRRQVLLAAPGIAVAASPAAVLAQAPYPARMVRIVVGNAAGETDDAISRFVADGLTKEFGQPVIVDNRGGASTTIAAAHVASSPPDGYTLFCRPWRG